MPMTVVFASDLERTLRTGSSADLRALLKTTTGEEREAIVNELNRRVKEETPRASRYFDEKTGEWIEAYTINPALYA